MLDEIISALFESQDALLEAAAPEREIFKRIEADIAERFHIDPRLSIGTDMNNGNIGSPYRKLPLEQAKEALGNPNLDTEYVPGKRRKQETPVDEPPSAIDIPDADPDKDVLLDREAMENGATLHTLVEYIRVKATGIFIYPPDDGFGIGNSQNAVRRLDTIAASKDTAHPVDDANIGGDWVIPPAKPDELNTISAEDINRLPDDFKDYIALLSKSFLPGILRIGFEEFGLASYLFYKPESHDTIRRRWYSYQIHKLGSKEKADRLAEALFPKTWNLNAIKHFASVVIPELVIRTKIAPMRANANCDKSLISQSKEYLGEENLSMMQDMCDDIGTPVTPNIEIAGKPLNYISVLRLVEQPNYDKAAIDMSRVTGEDGNRLKYNEPKFTPEEIELNGGNPPDNGSNHSLADYQTKTAEETEFPSVKIGDWYVIRVDKSSLSGDAETDNELGESGAFFSFSEPTSPSGRFYFRGGPVNNREDVTTGVQWCLFGGLLNNYRSFDKRDCLYVFVSKHALDSEVIKAGKGSHAAYDIYDATMFGLVFAGGGHSGKNDSFIPGLVKTYDFQARRNTGNRPGTPASTSHPFPTSIIPNSSSPEFTGYMYPKSTWDRDKRAQAYQICDTVFALSVLGKWNPSIKIAELAEPVDGKYFDCDELVELANKWFPVDMTPTRRSEDSTNAAMLTTDTRKTLTDLGDMGEAGDNLAVCFDEILNRKRYDDEYDSNVDERNYVSINGKAWFPLIASYNSVILVDGNKYTVLRRMQRMIMDGANNATPGMLKRLNDSAGSLPSLLFIRPPREKYRMYSNSFVPVNMEPLPFDRISSIDRDSLSEKLGQRLHNASNIGRYGEPSGELTRTKDGKEIEIKWLPKMTGTNSARNRVGISESGTICIRGEGTDDSVADLGISPPSDNMGPCIATYYVTDTNDVNLWFSGDFDSILDPTIDCNAMIGYVRSNSKNGMRVKWGLVVRYISVEKGSVLLKTQGDGYRIGSVFGNIAHKSFINKSYNGYVMTLQDNDVCESIGIDEDTLEKWRMDHNGTMVGLVTLVGHDRKHGGTVDWFDPDTLSFIGTTPIDPSELWDEPPRELHIC